MDVQIFQKILKPFQDSRHQKVNKLKFHMEDPQILGATV